MNANQLKQANIDNLTAVWQLMGTEVVHNNSIAVHASTRWPHKLWIDWAHQVTPTELGELIAEAQLSARQFVLPAWHVLDLDEIPVPGHESLKLRFRQTSMALTMSNRIEQNSLNPDLTCRVVSSDEDVVAWASIVSQAFGYESDVDVIRGIVAKPGITMTLTFKEDVPVGTGMLYESHNVVGIYWVGTSPDYRKQGIARYLMVDLLDRIDALGCPYATLQASPMGAPLYRQLGFEDQFVYSNFTYNA